MAIRTKPRYKIVNKKGKTLLKTRYRVTAEELRRKFQINRKDKLEIIDMLEL